MQLDQKALIEEAVQASIDAGLAVNGEHGVAAARHAQMTDALLAAEARVRELEKKLERARVALHVGLDLISEEKGWGTYPRMEGSEIYAEADVFRELARTTLAEIGQRE